MLDENRVKGLKPLSQLLLGADATTWATICITPTICRLKRLCLYNGKDTSYTHRYLPSHAGRAEGATSGRPYLAK